MATDRATPEEGATAMATPPRTRATRQAGSRSPPWANDVGRWSGIIILVIVLLALAFFLLAATKVLILAALFAVLFAGTFLPLVDWFEKHHVKRGFGAVIVTALLILLAVAIGALIVYSILKQVPTIDAKLERGVGATSRRRSRARASRRIRSTRSRPVFSRSPRTRPAGSPAPPSTSSAAWQASSSACSSASTSSSGASSRDASSAAGRPSRWGRCRHRWPTTSSPTAPGSSAATCTGARSWASSTAP